ncbi:EMB2759 protein [Hibiscus syriacus]|uniref:EMB2759 protein n=1 Tax=Hibiscus syriacus TaxID=106335 RepID=A0A6A3CBB4_HIBSY|nr:uncharacterized protein LOC120200902 isoform X2 [Hibiscus syriacus]KAE8726565.1 EMB2759 protein [Hibiscus syriacus]
MALVIHQLQGSYVAFRSRPLSCRKGLTLRIPVATLHMLGRRKKGTSLRHSTCLCSTGAHTLGLDSKNIRISAFKGSVLSDESGDRKHQGNVPKSSIKVSYVPKDGEAATIESSKAHNGPVAYASETGENVVGSPAIHKLFKKWIIMLRSQSPSQVVDDALGEAPPKDVLETQVGTQSNRKGEILKIVWCYFWDMNAAIKIPLLIFVPWYLGVNLIYGVEVSKELTPLWVFGPLIVALYIKMLRGLCTLYVFCSKQMVQLIRKLPTYYLLASNYIARGKLKEDVRALVWQPVEDMKNLDYKEVWRKQVNDFQERLMEKYLDFLESIWPYYCRTIRFLKKANFI